MKRLNHNPSISTVARKAEPIYRLGGGNFVEQGFAWVTLTAKSCRYDGVYGWIVFCITKRWRTQTAAFQFCDTCWEGWEYSLSPVCRICVKEQPRWPQTLKSWCQASYSPCKHRKSKALFCGYVQAILFTSTCQSEGRCCLSVSHTQCKGTGMV